MIAVRRSTLARVMADAVAAESRIAWIGGASVESATVEGEVTYRIGDIVQRLGGELVIGADGVGSVVREHGSFDARVNATGSTWLRTLVDVPPPFEGEIWTSCGLLGAASVGDCTYWYADATERSVAAGVAARDLEATGAPWRAALPAADPLWDAVRSFDDLLVNDVRVVTCQRYVDGSLVLLGDAAHAMEPTVGQGANSALVDAAVLVRELERASTTADALTAYDLARRPAVTRVQRVATTLARLSRIRNGAMRAVRNRTIALADRPASAQKRYRQLQQEDPATLLTQLRA
jgi:2-polyprenyl-6-methoxyphenol hydroxylase-like FAD-dependent oxidoreductase